ncbi:ABC transporter ATP-binding protein [Lacibacterium aquatile]|uniref:ABC transporter ATP-binding protein n=1 Tax=Lacibacterium aquatile TaxID=1168082 RepID=A0ABW5DXN0_9PROT
MAAIAEIKGLSLAYGPNVVLQGLDLTLERGSFVAIVGASGVGKSTLLRVLADLSKPSSGTVTTHFTQGRGHRPTSLVFQEARLLPWRRVLANIEFGLESLGLPKAERRDMAEKALKLVGLADFGKRWPYQLSGGQRQRVALARALALKPDLLLLDEPFGALDAITRAGMQDELLRLWRETGASVLMVTHDLDEAVYLADRVILLGGSPARIISDLQVPEMRPRVRGALKSAAGIRDELERTMAGGSGI